MTEAAEVDIPILLNINPEHAERLGAEEGLNVENNTRDTDIAQLADMAIKIAMNIEDVDFLYGVTAMIFFSLGAKLRMIDTLLDNTLGDDEIFGTVFKNAVLVFKHIREKGSGHE